MTKITQFKKRLLEFSANKQDFNNVFLAYLDTFPKEKYNAGREASLSALLSEMESLGIISLPSKTGPGWKKLPYHSEPLWIRVIREKKEKLNNSIAWHPKMRWGAEINSHSEYDNAKKVNEYFKRKGRENFLVSINERSLDIFGDEKKLSRMLVNNTLFGGKITLSDLSCYYESNPIIFQLFDRGDKQKVIIIENLASYQSFCRWNRNYNQYCCVIYGGGGALYASHLSIEDIGLYARQYEYVGDIDPSGISIPSKINRARLERGLPSIVPNTYLYERMALGDNWAASSDVFTSDYDGSVNWLPNSIKDIAIKNMNNKLRVPQEAIGLDFLYGISSIPS